MTELYLIAHKVRGQPAFDIAERCDDMDSEGDPGPWWSIPTSGHRAHPFWACQVLQSRNEAIAGNPITNTHPWVLLENELAVPLLPDPWPDHYPTAAEPRHSPTAGRGLLARLGLLRKTTIKRRV